MISSLLIRAREKNKACRQVRECRDLEDKWGVF